MEKENIKIEDDTITEIAHFSNGGFRDAIGMLDKLHSFTNDVITTDIFKQINGMISLSEIESFYDNILSKDLNSVLQMLDKIDEKGYDFKNFIEREMILVRDKVIDYYTKKAEIKGTINDNIELIGVLNDILNRLKDAVNPMVIVQIYILKYIESQELDNINNVKFISREINCGSNIEKNDVKLENVLKSNTNQSLAKNKDSNNIKTTKEIDSFKKTQIIINEDVKNVRINNAMATANITFKKELSSLWKK